MRYAIGRLCGSFISTTAIKRSALLLPATNTQRNMSTHQQQLWQQLTTQLEKNIKLEDDRYRKASERAWEINSALVRSNFAYERGDLNSQSTADEVLDKLVKDTVSCSDMYNNIVHENGDGEVIKVHERAPRLGGLSNKMEDYARYKAFHHFLAEEKLLSPNAPCFTTEEDHHKNILTDEEYLGGVCIGLCHDLSKYGVKRASNAVDDAAAVPFIKKARDVVSLILEELLQFDFRNGPLRRKYDSTKYALKTLETVLYELSVAGAVGGHKSLVGEEGEPPAKKIKVDEEKLSSGILPSKEITALRERLDHRDKLRESLIKQCRDGQKAAKQSIFAMHRGDSKKALTLLNDCEKCIKNDLIPILKEEPSLRYGSFSGVLGSPSLCCVYEEYVEGKLFYTWLHGDDEGNESSKTMDKAVGKILLPDDFKLNQISTEDYLGGLCDLTGEIGRYAVARGTARDKEGVKMCLEANKSIYMTLKMLGRLPKNISKKVGMVSKSVEKLERLLYEQSLIEATGRTAFASSVEENTGFDNTTEDN